MKISENFLFVFLRFRRFCWDEEIVKVRYNLHWRFDGNEFGSSTWWSSWTCWSIRKLARRQKCISKPDRSELNSSTVKYKSIRKLPVETRWKIEENRPNFLETLAPCSKVATDRTTSKTNRFASKEKKKEIRIDSKRKILPEILRVFVVWPSDCNQLCFRAEWKIWRTFGWETDSFEGASSN